MTNDNDKMTRAEAEALLKSEDGMTWVGSIPNMFLMIDVARQMQGALRLKSELEKYRVKAEFYKSYVSAVEATFTKESSAESWRKSYCLALEDTPDNAFMGGRLEEILLLLRKIELGYYL